MEAQNFETPLLEMSSRRRIAVTIGVITGMFIAALEATVVGTAMPTVIASLGGLSHYSWVFSAYLVTSTVTVPIWGKLSDLYGRRLIYQIGIGVFLLGTLLSGISETMTQLIAFRAIQGLGAGALVPLGMTIIGDIFTIKERAKMQAFFSGVWGLSSIIGPIIGGFLTDQLSWRWVFFINLPIGVAAALIIGFALKEPKHTEKPTIDYLGAVVLTTSITLLMLAMVEDGTGSFLTPEKVVLLIAAVILGILFVFIETRAKDPIMPLDLFKNKTISVAVILGFLTGVAMFGAISFVPLFSQGVLGTTATEAGSLLMPLMLSWVTTSMIVGRLLLKIDYRHITKFGFVVLTLGFVLLAYFDRTTPKIWLYLELVMVGCGLGMTMLTLLIAVQHAVERTRLGVATSLNQFSRSIGGAIGVAVMGMILSLGLTSALTASAAQANSSLTPEQAKSFAANPNALIDPQLKAEIKPEVLAELQQGMAVALHPVFWSAALMSLLSLFASFFLPKRDFGQKEVDGEKMVMASQTNINARNQPEV